MCLSGWLMVRLSTTDPESNTERFFCWRLLFPWMVDSVRDMNNTVTPHGTLPGKFPARRYHVIGIPRKGVVFLCGSSDNLATATKLLARYSRFLGYMLVDADKGFERV